MAENFIRTKEGHRFRFGGWKTNASPDKQTPEKFPLAVNIRGYTENSVRTRPGASQKFVCVAQPHMTVGVLTDMRAFADLGTDNLPRVLVRDSNGSIYPDTGIAQYVMAGGSRNPGVSMIPFRSNESASPQMYISSSTDYVKIPSPNAPSTFVSKVGIAEPQVAPEASIQGPLYQGLGDPNTSAGTAGANSPGTRTTDTVVAVFPWPASSRLFSVQTGVGVQYQRFQQVTFASANPGIVMDVFQQFVQSITIAGIFYFAGVSGRCVVVPANVGAAPGNEGSSIYGDALTTGLRRGALVKIGSEVCMVLSVTAGPDGTISFETSTVFTHTTADALTSVPSILVSMLSSATPSAGISEADRSYQVTVGVGTVTTAFSGFVLNQAFQSDDYISVGFNIDNLANLNEIKVLIDVGDGSFTQNFYYYTIRPSDIAAGVGNALTQLAVAQIVSQRATIDEEQAASANNQGTTASSAQTVPGSAQWSQILIPISSLTRVGDDQTKTLQQITKLQYLFNANATINVLHSGSSFIFGGSQVDVGDVGAPILYRVRPRSTQSGAVGNPSPATRYGVNPRRQSVLVTILGGVYDSQINVWDIFRYGGSITSWRYVGTVPSASTTFIDNFNDDAVNAGDALDFDNFEPWPTIDVPNNGTATQVCGTAAVVTSTDPDITGYLPGTLIQIGPQNVYTLRSRPTLISGTSYLLSLVENAGTGTNLAYSIQEPALANQHLPYLFGPDANGTVFGVGDQYRPGTLNFSKPYAPDSVPDSYNQEIVQPSEPLLGGEIVDGLACVASSERWWALYFQPGNPAQRFNAVQLPFPRGLGAPFAHCNDGVSIYWWAKDGIYSSTKGSLTDADLYNLFPHEGVVGQAYSYNGQTIPPPDYRFSGAFRLAFSNGYLYATYSVPGPGGLFGYQTLVCNVRTGAWSLDQYSPPVSCFYHPEQQAGSVQSAGTRYDELLMGAALGGVVSTQADLTNDIGGPISCQLATYEDDGGDQRAGEQWGDVFLDSTPAAQGAALVATPMAFSASLTLPITIAQSSSRQQQPISVGGEVLSNYLGLLLTWMDDFTKQNAATALHLWQPSFLLKPETIADRFTDWDDAGLEGAKWIQGFILHADTFSVAKGIAVRDADNFLTHPYTPIVQHNGESEKAYSFVQPFIAHMVRLEPTDQLPWRMFDLRWVAEQTPEMAETWQTQASSFGIKGFMHIRQVSLTYSSTTPVLLSILTFDGTSPLPINLPSTGGNVQKLVLVPTFNKAQLYFFACTSSAPFQIYVDKSEVLVGAWGRPDAYANLPLLGEPGGDKARI